MKDMNVGLFIEQQIERIMDSGLSRGPARSFVLGAMIVASYGPIGLAKGTVERAVGEFISLKPTGSRVSN